MENHNYMLIADDAGEFRDTCKAALWRQRALK